MRFVRSMVTRWQFPVVAFICLYIAVFTVFTIGRYERYNATGWDLGIFTNLTWNATQGRPLYNTVAEHNNMLAVHAPYITVVLAPLFWLWSDPRMLLIAQTVMLAVGAWPIARLARRHVSQSWAPAIMAAVWLLYPALGWNNRWDFHEITPMAMFLAFAFEATDRKRWREVALWLVLSILCKEEAGLNVSFFGLYLALRFKPRFGSRFFWLCAGVFVIGMAWFAVHAFVIFPALRGATDGLPIHASRYLWLLHGTPETIWASLTGPELTNRLAFLIKLFAPVGFVALLAPRPLLVALPTLVLGLLSDYQPQYDIFMHYTAPIIPCVFVAAIYGLKEASFFQLPLSSARGRPAVLPAGQSSVRRNAVFLMIGGTVILWIMYNPLFTNPPARLYEIYGWDSGASVEALNEVKAIIPPDSCVVTENNIQPHYSTRKETYVLGARGDDADGCTYMIVDLGDKRYDAFKPGDQVACYQFWSGKRAVIYFRDLVVVLKQMPTPDADANATAEMQRFCDSLSKPAAMLGSVFYAFHN